MKVLDEGHTYKLQDNKKPTETTTIQFFKDSKINGGSDVSGTTNQEVLRALINRIQFLDKQVPHAVNAEIVLHLRKALILHEQRHLDRLVEKGVAVELIEAKNTGHFV